MFRNPLSHNLGISDDPAKLFRGAVSDDKLETFERSEVRPEGWEKPTLKKSSRNRYILNIKIFYLGVRRMIWNILDARFSDHATESL